jgi:hypothetical protein
MCRDAGKKMVKPAIFRGQVWRRYRPKWIGHFVCALCWLFAALPCGAALTSPAITPEQLAAEQRAQRSFEVQEYLAYRVRLERIAYVVLQAASPYCVQNRKYSIGVPPISASDLPEDLRQGFAETQGVDASKTPRFMLMVPTSPVQQAGVDAGEELLSITDGADGARLNSGWVLKRSTFSSIHNDPLTLELSKRGTKHSVKVGAQYICDETPNLLRQDALIARISSGEMIVSTGLLRFVRNDDELALILATELANRILWFASGAAVQLPLLPNGQSMQTFSKEKDADYLGAYITALGGFNLERAKDVWRRISSNPPSRQAGGLAYIHPFSAERAIWLQAIQTEIHRKRLAGQQLAPDSKSLPADVDERMVGNTDANTVSPPTLSSDEVDPRLMRIADVPFIGNSGRSGYQRFLNTPLRPRAYAINPDSGTWAYRTGGNAAADALQACSQPFSPCYLYAVDDRVVWNPETLMRAPQPPSDTPLSRIARVDEVPLIDDEGRVGYRRFLELRIRPRAFAIGSSRGTGTTAAWAFKTGPNASADALARCMISTQGRPCYLYAVDDDVVWSLGDAPIETPNASSSIANTLQAPTASGFAAIDNLQAIPLPRAQLNTYQAFLEKPAPRAFVVTEKGIGNYWLGATAIEDALAYCERLDEPCWLYAVDNDVVWQSDKDKRISRRSQLSRQPEEQQYLK